MAIDPNSFIPVNNPENVYRARFPDIITTDGYYKDPIRFDVLDVFQKELDPTQFVTQSYAPLSIVERDQALFIEVQLNRDPEEMNYYMPIFMYQRVYDSEKVAKVIERRFNQF